MGTRERSTRDGVIAIIAIAAIIDGGLESASSQA